MQTPSGKRTYQIVELVTFHELARRPSESLTSRSARPRVAQGARGVLGRHRVREDAGRPLHPELVPEVRDDLPVPVELGLVAAVERAGVERDAVGRVVEDARRRASASTSSSASGGEPSSGTVPKSAACARHDPGLVRILEANGAKLTKSRSLRDEARARAQLLGQLVAERRSAPSADGTRARRRAPPRCASGVNGRRHDVRVRMAGSGSTRRRGSSGPPRSGSGESRRRSRCGRDTPRGAAPCGRAGSRPRSAAWSGVSVTSSWAPIAFITSNMPAPRAAEVALDAEQRMSIRRDAHAQPSPRRARDLPDSCARCPGQNGQARARTGSARLGAARDEVAGALGGDDHPAAEDGVAAELGHRRTVAGIAHVGPGASGGLYYTVRRASRHDR